MTGETRRGRRPRRDRRGGPERVRCCGIVAAPRLLRFEPTHRAASSARQEARQLLDDAGVPASVGADVELVIAELASNAVDQQPGSPIHLELTVGPDSVQVEVANRVPAGSPASPVVLPDDPIDDELAERGRGLVIVDRLSSELTVETVDGWTTVRVVVRYPRPSGEPG